MKQLIFLGLILRFSNLNVLHKGLLMQDWVFRLGPIIKIALLKYFGPKPTIAKYLESFEKLQ